MTKFEKTILIEGKVQGTYSRKAVLCEDCGKEILEDEIIYQIISKPDKDFHSKILARYHEHCFKQVRRAFQELMNKDLIEVC